jgi:hypothetical protein
MAQMSGTNCVVVLHLLMACASTPEPGVTGIYESWDDVITRWIGSIQRGALL